jgi:hypothetical protein
VLGAERERGGLHAEALDRGDALEHAQALAHHLGADAVTGDHGDVVRNAACSLL